MDPFEQMELKKSSLTKKELEIYEIVMASPDDILRNTATSMAAAHHVSQPAITRFCQKLGYQGFSDFRLDVYKYYKGNDESQSTMTAVDYYERLIHLIPGAVSEEAFERLAKRIAQARHISICGFHKSAMPAQLLEINLNQLGLMASYLPWDRTDFIHPKAVKEDLVIFFSVKSVTYRNTVDTIRELPPERRPGTVLITQTDKHPIRNKVDQVIWLPNYRNQGYPQYLESQIVPMIFADLLTSHVTNYIKKEGKTS